MNVTPLLTTSGDLPSGGLAARPETAGPPSAVAGTDGAAPAAGTTTVDLSALGRQLLTQSLSAPPVNHSAVPANTPPSPDQSAGVILGFIRQHLQQQAAAGADQATLRQTLEQGLRGFRRGLAEATTILQHLGRLNDAVRQGIETTGQRVLSGLQALARDYGLSDNGLSDIKPAADASVPAVTPPPAGTAAPTAAAGSQSGTVADLQTRAAFIRSRFQQNESVQLQVQTRDGDVITLSLNTAARSDSTAIAAGAANGQQSSAVQAYRQVSQSGGQLSFSVQGKLDKGELSALRSLLGDISNLSDAFFSGNLQQALSLASSLQLDGSEFSSLSLNMSVLTRSSVVAGVQSGPTPENTSSRVQPSGGQRANTASAPADKVGAGQYDQLQQLLGLLGSARLFHQPGQLLSNLLAARMAGSSNTATTSASG